MNTPGPQRESVRITDAQIPEGSEDDYEYEEEEDDEIDDAPIDSDENLSDIEDGSARGGNSMNASIDIDKPDMGLISNEIINKMKKPDSPKNVDQPQRPSNVMSMQ